MSDEQQIGQSDIERTLAEAQPAAAGDTATAATEAESIANVDRPALIRC